MSNVAKADDRAQVTQVHLLTFILDQETYGTDISQIQEVLEYRKVTTVPRTPSYMLGVINLRGNVVPVVDLRQQFDMQVSDISIDTCIIIVDVIVDGEKTPLGILADAVKEVIVLGQESVAPPPRIGSRIDTRFISGMGKRGGEFIIILDLPKIFSQGDLEDVIHTAQHLAPEEVSSEQEAAGDDQQPDN